MKENHNLRHIKNRLSSTFDYWGYHHMPQNTRERGCFHGMTYVFSWYWFKHQNHRFIHFWNSQMLLCSNFWWISRFPFSNEIHKNLNLIKNYNLTLTKCILHAQILDDRRTTVDVYVCYTVPDNNFWHNLKSVKYL